MVIFLLAMSSACLATPEIDDPQVEGVCVNDAVVVFSGGGNAARSSIDLTQLDLDLDRVRDARITLNRAVVAAGPGIDHLGFADRVRVELVPRSGPVVPLAETSVAVTTATIDLVGNPQLDLASYLFDEPGMAIEITGELPATGWSATVDLCFDVDAP